MGFGFGNHGSTGPGPPRRRELNTRLAWWSLPPAAGEMMI
jgi:hypothetical protein